MYESLNYGQLEAKVECAVKTIREMPFLVELSDDAKCIIADIANLVAWMRDCDADGEPCHLGESDLRDMLSSLRDVLVAHVA